MLATRGLARKPVAVSDLVRVRWINIPWHPPAEMVGSKDVMKLEAKKQRLSVLGGGALLMAVLVAGPELKANVYASNIKLNGGLSSVTNNAGTPVTISYILNEPATLGTTINILSGATVVDSISIAAGNAGTLRGTNSVVWGGTNSSGANVPGGIYSVSITPESSGYTNWTQ